MASAVDLALRAPVEAGRHRYVFFLTDGYVGEEHAIARGARELVDRQRRDGRRARVFAVGIGDAPNSHLIDLLSKAGSGAPLHVRGPRDLARAGQTVERLIDAPVLTDLDIAWGSLSVRDLSLASPPDLFASHPVVIHGRYEGSAPAALQLRGRVGERSVTFPIEVVAAAESDPVLARLWARDRIAGLELAAAVDPYDAGRRARDEILALGLRHHLVTQFTSLVAVDRSRRVHGPAIGVVQPVEVPAGVDPDMAGAVRLDGAQVTRVRLDQARNIPVGGSSRDFTAVVDLSPTASRDAPGIRLGGSTGAESRYVVEGANATAPAFGTVGAAIVQEFIDAPPPLARGFQAVEPYARARIHRVSAVRSGEADALRARLRGELEALAQCFVDAEPATYRVHRRLVLVVHVDPRGNVTRLDVRARRPPTPAISACLRQRLDPLVRAAITRAGTVEIDLGVWMRF
jgi:Ca-activated chloride channel family protein